jgi:hypothetical protein
MSVCVLIGDDEVALPVLICSQYRRFSRTRHSPHRMLKGHSRRSFAHESRQRTQQFEQEDSEAHRHLENLGRHVRQVPKRHASRYMQWL